MQEYLDARRERCAAAWALSDEIVLVGAGEPIGIPGGADQTYPFRAHAEYYYLTDRNEPGCVLAFDPRDGWRDFVPEVTDAQRLWEGRDESGGEPLGGLAGWLAARRGRSIVMLGSELPALRFDMRKTLDAREALLAVRRPKDAEELRRLRKAAHATAAGYARMGEIIRAGTTERAIQVALESEFARGCGDGPAYGTIVGAGSNAAVLHFSPTERVVRDGDLVLIDAGAEVQRYACDVTRTYCAGGNPSAEVRELYDVVRRCEERGIDKCVAGAEWREIHLGACRDIADGLVQMGILRGRPDSLVEQDAVALFFPHGIGHLVGLGVRDASGILPGRQRSTRPGLSTLRMDLPLGEGFVTTVEPGVYFVRAILCDAARRQKHRDAVNWARVDRMMDLGGVRIEDNVLVTSEKPEVLTSAMAKGL